MITPQFINSLFKYLSCFWIFVIMVLLVFTGIIAHLLAEIYFQNPTNLARSKPKYVTDIPFPSVVICPIITFSSVSVRNFIKNRWVIRKSLISINIQSSNRCNSFLNRPLPKNRTNDQVAQSFKTIYIYTNKPKEVEPNTEDIHISDKYLTFNNLSIADVF